MKLPGSLHSELALGQRELITAFGSSIPHILKAGEIPEATGLSGGLLHLRTGWACQFPDITSGRRTIVDVYLPGDVIGLNTLLRNQPLKNVLVLTSAIAQVIPPHRLVELMANRSTALFVAWLQGQRQRRTYRLLAAVSGLDARGRIASMILDFHQRLRRRRLITGLTYSLPLSQAQIGQYLGLTVVHVNRVLQSLRAERIIELEKNCVTILDHDRLSSVVENHGTKSSNTSVSDYSAEAAIN